MAYTYKYPRPMVTVDVVIFSKDAKHVVLIKRANEPFKGRWALPGGFCGIDELLTDAARRELEEETGLTGVSLHQVGAFDTLGRDPRGRVITIAFFGFAPDGAKVHPATDSKEAKWFPLDALPELTFDHGEIVKAARNKAGSS